MVIHRQVPALESGDKRAIASLETLLLSIEPLYALEHKVRCLEQIVLGAISEGERFAQIALAICAEPEVDKTMSICFSCYSEAAAEHQTVLEALRGYIGVLRARAPTILT